MTAHWTHERLKAKTWKGESFRYCQEKLDGHRLTFFKQSNESVVAYGSTVSPELEMTLRFPKLRQNSLYDALMSRRVPKLTSVDCEVIVQGGTSTDVPTALRDKKTPLVICPFAIPVINGVTFHNLDLEDVEKHLDDWLQSDYDGIILPELFTNVEDDRDYLERFARDLKIEGWILKSANYTDWYKLKLENPVDAVVTGIVPGQGKYSGSIGALLVSVRQGKRWVEIASVSGMTDAEREKMTRMYQRKKLLGKVCEVKYQQVTPGKRLRHPRFKRWRSDKEANACTIDQIL